jgi:hypothetical protein
MARDFELYWSDLQALLNLKRKPLRVLIDVPNLHYLQLEAGSSLSSNNQSSMHERNMLRSVVLAIWLRNGFSSCMG